MTPILEVSGLQTYFRTLHGTLRAVDGVSFPLGSGEILGLAGESGCGKTTTGLSIMRLLPDGGRIAGGRILYNGTDLLALRPGQMRRVRWREISMVFQGAMNALNPVRRIRDQIMDVMLLHQTAGRKVAEREVGRLLELVGISADRARDYPHEFSGGMRQRVMIAMALACKPRVVIADEPTTALDVMIQAQILQLLKDLQKQLGLSLIVVSHDLGFLGELCDKIGIMYAGKIAEYGSADQVLVNPRHPYSQALLAAIPRIRGPRTELRGIPGDPPNLVNPPPGCLFRERCPHAAPLCAEADPIPLLFPDGRQAACHLYADEQPPGVQSRSEEAEAGA